MFKGKKILVIGGTGTIGKALVKHLIKESPTVLRVFSRDEYKQFIMREELTDFDNIRFLIGDIRDKERLNRAMSEIDYVFDLAALKHVPVCEYNPFEAVKTNVMGTQNVIECALQNKVERVIYTSSDKAVAPTNTMGATKLLAERLISSADFTKGSQACVFSAVRFGNVIGSRGSVIPLWQEQIRYGNRITITDPEMTRFMMSISDAVHLLVNAYRHASGGEVFVLKMPVLKLKDLADVVVEHECIRHGIDKNEVVYDTVGLRPGEKLFEELMTVHEAAAALEYEDMFAIMPHHKVELIEQNRVKRAFVKEYSSQYERTLQEQEIRLLLKKANVLLEI